MSNKFDIIGNLANALAKTGDTFKALGIAELLNQNNHKTAKGKPYSTKSRGIFKVISAAYHYFVGKGDKTTATNIASAYVNKKNKHAWKK
ncbi:hypothetical protein [Fibrobacter sp.]|uniref:hypothetical protein n=1 Tax=Fibrobacter sp. TaxID=35828 RepID=UPI00386A7284